VDAAIDEVLANAAHSGAKPDQVGRLSAVLNSVAGTLRGDANGVMFTQWNSDPKLLGSLTTLNSDSVANNQRERHQYALPALV